MVVKIVQLRLCVPTSAAWTLIMEPSMHRIPELAAFDSIATGRSNLFNVQTNTKWDEIGAIALCYVGPIDF